jgi:NADH dehydrogenase (ubiquinone) 1 alpha subcomplex subunit 9
MAFRSLLRSSGVVPTMAATNQRRFAGVVAAPKWVTPAGKGGRSSVNGAVATVFGGVGHWSPGNGFLGRYVIQQLGKQGAQIVIPYYGDELETRYLRVMGDLGQIHFQEYGILDNSSIAQSVQYSNVAINLTGLNYKTRHFSCEDVNVTGAANIAKAAKEAGIERFVHLSALGADSSNTKSEFLRTKGLGEEAVLDVFPDATIIRPGMMFGPEDLFIKRLADLCTIMPGPFILPNMGEAVKAPVYVADVANAVVNAISDPSSAGQTYEFVGPTDYTMKELITYITDTIRKPKMLLPIPDAIGPIEITPLVLFGMSLPGVLRMPTLPNEEEFYHYSYSDVQTRKALGLSDLGVTPTRLEEVGLNILRRYRSHLYHDDIDAVLGESK